jgi:hypothetical protein
VPYRQATRWAIFLRNHREVIAAMDFFIVPTLTSAVSTGHAMGDISAQPS